MNEMEILQVVFSGEMPSTCYKCKLLLVEIEMAGAWGIDLCVFAPNMKVDYEKLAKKNIRPNFCPLVKQKELPKYKARGGKYDDAGGTIPSVESENE